MDVQIGGYARGGHRQRSLLSVNRSLPGLVGLGAGKRYAAPFRLRQHLDAGALTRLG